MDKQRLLELAGIVEAGYDQPHLGTIEHSFTVQDRVDAYRLASYLQFPDIGWHAKVSSGGNDRAGRLGEYTVTVVINVHRDNLKK